MRISDWVQTCALPIWCLHRIKRSLAPMIFDAFTRGKRLHFTQCFQWLQLLQKSLVSGMVHAKLLDSKELSMPEQIGMTRHIVAGVLIGRSEEHTSELQSLMRTSYAVF